VAAPEKANSNWQLAAISNWQLAKTNPRNLKTKAPDCDPLPIGIGLGIGWPLGDPSVAQGPPKRDASEALASNGESVLFATKVGKRPGRVVQRSGDPVIGTSGDQEKQTLATGLR